MSAFPDLAPIGSLLGDSTRATMIAELMDGRALTAGELASRAGVSASTASTHLARLVSGGLVAAVNQGRYRYHRLASPAVASALESLTALAPMPIPRNRFEREVLSGLKFARSCYGHLAGYLGVALRERLLAREIICEEGGEHRVLPSGVRWFAVMDVDLDAVRMARRSYARVCIDWSERRPHLAGALGDALLTSLIERDWVRRLPGERALELTAAGRRGLEVSLGLSVEAAMTLEGTNLQVSVGD